MCAVLLISSPLFIFPPYSAVSNRPHYTMEVGLASSSPFFSSLKLFSPPGRTGGSFPHLKAPNGENRPQNADGSQPQMRSTERCVFTKQNASTDLIDRRFPVCAEMCLPYDCGDKETVPAGAVKTSSPPSDEAETVFVVEPTVTVQLPALTPET